MRKRTIIKCWVGGLVIQIAGVILTTVMTFVMVAHVTAENANFVPDNFFWTAIALMILGGIIFWGGSLAQLVAQIGALFNTHRLADQTWFRALLWSSIVGYVLLFGTFGLQFGLGYSGNVSAGLVWPGYVVGSLIETVLMLCYLVAGPDGIAEKLGESAINHVAEELVQA
ncbi:MAG TPA: hypothetical protein VJ761_11635 [Ktedonobacteraceae bacterium]|nr:hypothetical protein [Ktedonobacteraceae bacterium]